jgi:hypothetical protein
MDVRRKEEDRYSYPNGSTGGLVSHVATQGPGPLLPSGLDSRKTQQIFLLHQRVQAGSGANPASYIMSTGAKAADE